MDAEAWPDTLSGGRWLLSQMLQRPRLRRVRRPARAPGHSHLATWCLGGDTGAGAGRPVHRGPVLLEGTPPLLSLLSGRSRCSGHSTVSIYLLSHNLACSVHVAGPGRERLHTCWRSALARLGSLWANTKAHWDVESGKPDGTLKSLAFCRGEGLPQRKDGGAFGQVLPGRAGRLQGWARAGRHSGMGLQGGGQPETRRSRAASWTLPQGEGPEGTGHSPPTPGPPLQLTRGCAAVPTPWAGVLSLPSGMSP